MYTGIRRHVSIATQQAVLQSLYTIDNKLLIAKDAFTDEGCLSAYLVKQFW